MLTLAIPVTQIQAPPEQYPEPNPIPDDDSDESDSEPNPTSTPEPDIESEPNQTPSFLPDELNPEFSSGT